MIKTDRNCPRCGLVFVSEKLEGLCPSCLLAGLFADDADDDTRAFWEDDDRANAQASAATTTFANGAPAAPPARRFSHFEILEELGRGGMGIVYRARDLGTGRIVALKVLQAHHLEVPDLVQRFRAEVRAVTSLDHPHVLPVHEVGEYEGIPFFSMKLTTGGSLAQRLGDFLGKPKELARLMAKVARGVAHAHERGILHRDLKPGNILLDATGEPFVCDFGLAKWIEDDRNLTITAAVLGTPHYIAPEQASGQRGLTTTADIYSLGAILYELLTARPPFVGTSIIETLRLASEHAPERPSSLAQNIPRDLETICLKCLQREPGGRYASAAALADDLENWLAGRPIHARPVGAAGQLWRWAKRNPLPAALAASVAILLVATAVVATVSAVRIEKSRTRAVAAEKERQEQLYHALLAQAKAARLTGRAGQRFQALAALTEAAKIRPSVEVRSEAAAALALGDFQIERAWQVGTTSRPTRAFDESLEHFFDEIAAGEVRMLRLADMTELHRFRDPANPARVECILPPAGPLLPVRYANGTVIVWDTQTGQKRHEISGLQSGAAATWYAFDCALSRDARWLAVGDRAASAVRLFEAGNGREIARIALPAPASCFAFSADGARLVAGSSERPHVMIMDLASRALTDAIPTEGAIYHIACDDHGRQIAAASADFNIYLCVPGSPTPRGVLRGHRQEVIQVLFADHGDRLISTSRDRTVRLWSLSAMTQEVTLGGYGSEPALRLSKDGTRLALTDASPNAYLAKIGGLDPFCRTMINGRPQSRAMLSGSIAFSPDARRLATTSFESLDLWDVGHGRLETSFDFDQNALKSVRFGKNADELLIASEESGLAFYKLTAGSPPKLELTRRLDGEKGFVFGNIPAEPAGWIGLTAMRKGIARIFDLQSGQDVLRLEDLHGVWDLAVSPDRAWLALSFSSQASESAGKIQVWSRSERRLVHTLPGGRANAARFTPDGRWLKAHGAGLDQGVWKVGDWTHHPSPDYPGGRHVFSSSGGWVASVAQEKDRVLVMDIDQGTLRYALEPPLLLGSSFRLAASADGRFLAAQSADNTVMIWDLQKLDRHFHLLELQN